MGDKHYSVFGLNIQSTIALPELHLAPGSKTPDVSITAGRVHAPRGAKEGLHRGRDALILVIPEVARFQITGGAAIVIDADGAASERDVRLFLLGSAMGALLHQRGLLPLHANGVAVGGHSVAFLGPSGEGKSTLAAWFHDFGHEVIADDVCAVMFEAGTAVALPGLPRLRLWKDALTRTGRDHLDYERSYGSTNYDKFDVPISEERLAPAPLPLAALYRLERGTRFHIRQLSRVAALEAVMSNVYRGEFLEQMEGFRSNWEECLRLIASVPVFACCRTWEDSRYDDEARMMLAHATQWISGDGRELLSEAR